MSQQMKTTARAAGEKTLYWTRPVPIKWLDSWLERLAFIDRTRLTVVEKPGKLSARLQVYPPDQATAQKLVKNFGGTLRTVAKKDWLHASQHRDPIKIGTRLIVCAEHQQAIEEQRKFPRRIVLEVPCGMAFGTGDHATTGMMLAAIAQEAPLAATRVLDIGTGSGLLALAARALGAGQVEAFDYDAQAVAIAIENERINFPQPQIRWRTQDLAKWRPTKVYDLITANLYLETLSTYAPKFAQALAPQGQLLVSGLLRTQGQEIIAAFRQVGLVLQQEYQRKAWLMQVWSQPASR